MTATLSSGRLPASYDTWRTSGSNDPEAPEELHGYFECEKCGHLWDTEGDVVTFKPSSDPLWGEATISGTCSECGEAAIGNAGWDPM